MVFQTEAAPPGTPGFSCWVEAEKLEYRYTAPGAHDALIFWVRDYAPFSNNLQPISVLQFALNRSQSPAAVFIFIPGFRIPLRWAPCSWNNVAFLNRLDDRAHLVCRSQLLDGRLQVGLDRVFR